MNKNSIKKEQQKQYEIKNGMIKKSRLFFAYVCIVLLLFLEIPL